MSGKLNSSVMSTGLFWFLDGWSKLRVEDEKNFNSSSLGVSDFTMESYKHHKDYKAGSDNLPRGRVAVYNGTIFISVGYTCPPEGILAVKKRFKMDELADARFEIERTVEYDRVYPVDEHPDEDYESFEEKDEDAFE